MAHTLHVLLATLALGFLAQDAAPPLVDGAWGGWVELAGSELWFQVRADGRRLLLEDFQAGPPEVAAVDPQRVGDRVSFVYPAGIGPTTFRGRVDGREWAGDVTCDGFEPGRFRLIRFHDLSDERLAAVIGRYEDERGRIAWVVPRTFGGVRIVERAAGTGFAGFLMDAWLPLDEGAFFSAEADAPRDREVALVQTADGLRAGGPRARTLRRTAGAARLARFRSGEVELHGWLLLPPGRGPHPAVAYAHGSGYVAADSPFDLYVVQRLVEDLGIAVLRWDKRGVGRSTGDQGLASYHDLAEDALAAHAWLRRQEGIDPERVGLGGLSQAPSWPLPIAAAREPEVAFVIALSGSVETAADTNTFHWTNRLRAMGFDEEEVAQARAFYRELLPLAARRGAEAESAYAAGLRHSEGLPWFDAACELGGLRTRLDDPIVERWRRIGTVDPIDSWRNVACPVFQAWGADDLLVDVTRSAARMRDLVAETGQTNFTSIVYPAPADHAVGSGSTPTFFEDLRRWFEEEVLESEPGR